jgi:Bromodomain
VYVPEHTKPSKRANKLTIVVAGFLLLIHGPVDPAALNIPSYHKTIKKLMDFGVVEANLSPSQYAEAQELYHDANLVFQNCFIPHLSTGFTAFV